MANTSHMVEIIPEKLRDALDSRMLIPAEVSRDIGFCSAYISKTYSKGRCSYLLVKRLEEKYGIMPDEYVRSKAKKPIAAEKPSDSIIEEYVTKKELLHLCAVVYNALRKTLTE